MMVHASMHVIKGSPIKKLFVSFFTAHKYIYLYMDMMWENTHTHSFPRFMFFLVGFIHTFDIVYIYILNNMANNS